MPSTEAQLILSCKGTGTSEVNRFNDAVAQADKASERLKGTLAGLFSTAAVLAFGTAAVRTYSDLQEATQKFYEVFNGLEEEATKEAKRLEEQFGASARSAKSMLSMTGDMLTGFGFARDEALRLSAQVAQLGSDIASFSNYAGGAEGAAYAITKAMLGEAESAKMLGIAIRMDSEEYKELYNRIKETRGTTDSQTKALVALQIAFSQKKNAMGDFERNIGSIANRGRILSNELEDLRANIGRGLSEGVSEGQQALINLLRVFNDLSQPQQDFIVKTGSIFSGLMIAKTAIGAYNLFSAMTGTIAVKNSIEILKEAEAHKANTAAIIEENNAKQTNANPVFAAQQALKSNKIELQIAKHRWKQAIASNESPENIAKLQNEYKKLLITRRELSKNAFIAQSNQKMGTFNQTIALTNKQMANMTKQFKFPTFAKGINGILTGMRGIGSAAQVAGSAIKGMMASLGPMLLLSAAIAGIDWLINRKSRANEERNQIAQQELETANSSYEAVQKSAQQDRDRLQRYQELASYSDRTAEEQQELLNIAQELNGTYKGLNVPLLQQKDVVSDISGLWDKINKQQRESAKAALEQRIVAARNAVTGLGMVARDKVDKWNWTGFDDGGKKRAAYFKTSILSLPFHQQAKELQNFLKILKEANDAEGYQAVSEYLAKIQELLRMQGEYREFMENPKTIIPTDKPSGEALLQGNKTLRDSRRDLENERWMIEFRNADRKKQLEMLQKKKADYEAQRKLIRDSETDIKRIQEKYRLSREILKVESEIADIQKQTAEQILAEFTRQREEQISFVQELYQAASGYRETAQSYISANSEQAARMQSRMLMSPEFKMEPQKKMAFTAEAIKAILERWQQQEKETRDAVTEIQKKLNFSGY